MDARAENAQRIRDEERIDGGYSLGVNVHGRISAPEMQAAAGVPMTAPGASPLENVSP